MSEFPSWLRAPEAAAYLGLSASTLAKMRLRGDGPPFSKAGRRIVVYEVADLQSFLACRRHRSTSEPDPEIGYADPRTSGSASAARGRAWSRSHSAADRDGPSSDRSSAAAAPPVRRQTPRAPERSTLRTVLRDTFKSRTISLIDLPLTKNSRRIRAIVSTTSIPQPTRVRPQRRAASPTSLREGQHWTPITPQRGSKLHAELHVHGI